MKTPPVFGGHRRRHQRGAVAIIVGISIVALIGFVGLALDLGKLFIAKTELQNSSDACALAASRELTGANASQLEIAEAAGMTTGAVNRVIFQGEAVVLYVNDSVTFSNVYNGPYLAKNAIGPTEALAMKYVRCTVSRAGIANWFIQVLNVMPGIDIGSQTVASTAVASLSPAQTNCAIPVGLCSVDPDGNPLAGKPVGTWLEGAIGPPGSGGLTGNFKWIDFTPPAGGASELAGILKGAGACNIPSIGAEVGQPGNVASLGDDWNSRFGIYKGSTNPPPAPNGAVPDFTGYGYTDAPLSWPSKFGAYADFVSKRTSNTAYQGDASTLLTTQGTIKDSTFLSANGADRRLAIVPVVNCDDFVSGSTAPVQSWACILMLHPINNSAGGSGTGATRMYLEYRGISSDPTSPCATLGLSGSEDSAGPKVPVLVQ
ncbi:MAG: pilus assembly protein [Burkholderiales bacterium RIFCSPHIGHO2_12_FULL_61_11]|nr:MAG: pilus assembly protein [Burkholderiales bacterium RIFCSPHIGHO2_12_FULL_61_11]